jgi:ribosomal protein S2
VGAARKYQTTPEQSTRVYGKGPHGYRRDRALAMRQRTQARKARKAIHREGYPIRVVATGETYGPYRRQVNYDAHGRIGLSERWTSGRLTNEGAFRKWLGRHRRTRHGQRVDADGVRRFGWTQAQREAQGRTRAVDPDFPKKRDRTERKRQRRRDFVDDVFPRRGRSVRPGRIVVLQPNRLDVCRKEAIECGIPTRARVDVNCPCPERVTYPVPGNGESLAAQVRKGPAWTRAGRRARCRAWGDPRPGRPRVPDGPGGPRPTRKGASGRGPAAREAGGGYL